MASAVLKQKLVQTLANMTFSSCKSVLGKKNGQWHTWKVDKPWLLVAVLLQLDGSNVTETHHGKNRQPQNTNFPTKRRPVNNCVNSNANFQADKVQYCHGYDEYNHVSNLSVRPSFCLAIRISVITRLQCSGFIGLCSICSIISFHILQLIQYSCALQWR